MAKKKTFSMMTNLRDIRDYDKKIFDKVINLIKTEDDALYDLVKRDLLPLTILGFPVNHRKVLLHVDKATGRRHYKSSFVVRVYKRHKGKVLADCQIYLGENKLNLKEIKQKVINFFHARRDILTKLELEDQFEEMKKAVE